MGGTLVLNASYEVLTSVSWQRAITLVATGEAEIHEEDPHRQIRSQHLSFPFPRAIRLLKYVFVKYRDRASLKDARASKRGVLVRDKHTCAYCGGPANTVDHVVPQCRGGQTTWENMVAACQPCNQRKADTPLEKSGMRLLWEPYRPDMTGMYQRQVWRTLAVTTP